MRQRLFQAVFKHNPIRQIGQRIVIRLMLHQQLLRLTSRHIMQDRDKMGELSLLIHQRSDHLLKNQGFPILPCLHNLGLHATRIPGRRFIRMHHGLQLRMRERTQR